MAVQGQTEFQGNTYTVVHNGNTIPGVLDVKVVQTGGGKAEPIDVTTNADSVYTYIADALGAKTDGKVTVTITCQLSSVYEATAVQAIALNTSAATVITFQPATSLGNVFTDALELTSRTTTIPLKAMCPVVLVFEANGSGAWTAPVVA